MSKTWFCTHNLYFIILNKPDESVYWCLVYSRSYFSLRVLRCNYTACELEEMRFDVTTILTVGYTLALEIA